MSKERTDGLVSNPGKIITLPVRGLVVRHAFLWHHEKIAGRDEGTKDRPAVIVLLVRSDMPSGTRVGVVPITHAHPKNPATAVEVPDKVKRQLGFDPDVQWIVLDQINRFVWPGYDLRRVPRTDADHYGMLPESLFNKVLAGILELHRQRKVTVTDRD